MIGQQLDLKVTPGDISYDMRGGPSEASVLSAHDCVSDGNCGITILIPPEVSTVTLEQV